MPVSDLLTNPILIEWGSLILRWAHVIAAIGWIGSSFYFIALDLSLRKHDGLPAGVGGETWQVHGGGFYRMQKYLVAPSELPKELTWFKWEAYATWLSGFAIMVWIYYIQADIYLIDPAVMRLPKWAAIGISIGTIILAVPIYNALCKSPLGQNEYAFAAVGFVLLVAAGWGFLQLFSPRAAFLQLGAVMATLMAASVAHVIIPNQRKVVADLIAGRTPDPALGKAAKQRSLHNNYMTFPVVLLMLSNHYPLAYASQHAWAVMGLIIVAGAAGRHALNLHHRSGAYPIWPWLVAALALALAISASLDTRRLAPAAAVQGERAVPDEHRDPRFVAAVEVVQTRCAMCHADEPVWAGIQVAPRGVRLDTPEEIARHAHVIRVQAVMSRAMPPGNVTEITAEERQVLAAWLERR
jgi:uncharacterized membrane protein